MFNSHAPETEYLPQTSRFNIKGTENPQLVTSSFGKEKALNYPDQPPSSSILQVPKIRKASPDQIFQYKEIIIIIIIIIIIFIFLFFKYKDKKKKKEIHRH